MPYVHCYTKAGDGVYDYTFYPEHTSAYNCDWEHAMHLAYSEDGKEYIALRNNTGILFPKCTFDEGPYQGTTKTLIDPWMFRKPDGSFGVAAIRRNRNAADPKTTGQIMLFTSKDLIRYEEAGFLSAADGEIRNPKCKWDDEKQTYVIEFIKGEELYRGETRYFKELRELKKVTDSVFESADGKNIEGEVPGNTIEVTDEELKKIRGAFDVIENTGVEPIVLETVAGIKPRKLPKATCTYSDGSTHDKLVDWNQEDLSAVNYDLPGEYNVRGTVQQKSWRFPLELSEVPGAPKWMPKSHISDPCILQYQGRYYLTSSGGYQVIVRAADTLEDVFTAKPVVVYTVPEGPMYATWAAELHVIHGVVYMFTALCPGDWRSVESVVLRCNGLPDDPDAWEAPRYCLKPNGRMLTEGGISLDMTYFCVNGVHYVMWSDRKIKLNQEPVEISTADIFIATIDPDEPWQLTTEPRCVIRPIYGWDRFETEVDEGPYLLRHGDDIYVTIAGSSTGMADLYDIGLLHAKVGDNLLTPDGWEWLPYPIVTKESVENQYGPGHNCFTKDRETGDDLIVFHAVPHDEIGKPMGRRAGIRRVHWAANGYPYLEMTIERDLKPEYRDITMKVIVK